MHDLDTIKRLNSAPSKRNEGDNPAPQPTRAESAAYYRATLYEVRTFRDTMQSPAMDREVLE